MAWLAAFSSISWFLLACVQMLSHLRRKMLVKPVSYKCYQTFVLTRMLVKTMFMPIANTKKYGTEALINSTISSWNDIQKYFSSNKMLRDAPTFKLKSLLKKQFLETYNTS